MALSPPPYIPIEAIVTPELRFEWDDWTATAEYDYDSSWIVAALSAAAVRAQVAFGIGVYEWILWRFSRLSNDPIPYQVAEAAWCGNIHRSYLRYTELPRPDWPGPIRGPLWFAMTWLLPMVCAGENATDERESGLSYLPKMAARFLPDVGPFERWLRPCIERLVRDFPAPHNDPLDDLFSQTEEERRGDYVAREALDPAFPITAARSTELAAMHLALVDRANPFLRSGEELTRDGFPGTPFLLR